MGVRAVDVRRAAGNADSSVVTNLSGQAVVVRVANLRANVVEASLADCARVAIVAWEVAFVADTHVTLRTFLSI